MSFVTLDKATGKAPAAPARSGRSSRALPSVNLLSPATLEHLTVARLKKRFLAGGLAVAVVVGGGWAVQTQRLHAAEDRLAAENAATPPLTAQVAALEPVAQFYNQVDQRKQTASAAMAAEVLFSQALTDLKNRTPAGMTIQTMAVTLTPDVVTAIEPPVSPLAEAGIDGKGVDTTGKAATPKAATPKAATGTTTTQNSPVRAAPGTAETPDPAAALENAETAKAAASSAAAAAVSCARPDPFNPAVVIGCVTLTGTADSRAVVGRLIEKLKASDLYADPFITTTTAGGAEGEESVTFSGSVGLTGKAVSGRYADLSWLADPSVLAKAEKLVESGQTASAKLAVRAERDAVAEKARKEAEAEAEAKAEAAAQAAAEQAAADQIQQAAAAAAAAAATAAAEAAAAEAAAAAAAQGNAGAAE